jgi:hypothetical protein
MPGGSQEFPSVVPSWGVGAQMMKQGNELLKGLAGHSLEFIKNEVCDLLQPFLNMLDFTPHAALAMIAG